MNKINAYSNDIDKDCSAKIRFVAEDSVEVCRCERGESGIIHPHAGAAFH